MRSLRRLVPEVVWNPIYLSSSALQSSVREAIASVNVQVGDKWLDLGCGLRPFEDAFPSGSYVGLDIEVSGRDQNLKAPDFTYDGEAFPFADESYNGLLATEVFEHVPNPDALLAEANRVLAPGSYVIISTPFVWREHEIPYDFFRYTCYGMSRLLTDRGFVVERIIKTTHPAVTISMNWIAYLINEVIPKGRITGIVFTGVVAFPTQCVAYLMSKVLPDGGNLFTNLVVVAKKPAQSTGLESG